MREDRRVHVSSAALGPDEVAGRTFAMTFRGFDTTEVRTYLGRVADELRQASERERELRHLLAADPQRLGQLLLVHQPHGCRRHGPHTDRGGWAVGLPIGDGS